MQLVASHKGLHCLLQQIYFSVEICYVRENTKSVSKLTAFSDISSENFCYTCN